MNPEVKPQAQPGDPRTANCGIAGKGIVVSPNCPSNATNAMKFLVGAGCFNSGMGFGWASQDTEIKLRYS